MELADRRLVTARLIACANLRTSNVTEKRRSIELYFLHVMMFSMPKVLASDMRTWAFFSLDFNSERHSDGTTLWSGKQACDVCINSGLQCHNWLTEISIGGIPRGEYLQGFHDLDSVSNSSQELNFKSLTHDSEQTASIETLVNLYSRWVVQERDLTRGSSWRYQWVWPEVVLKVTPDVE